MPPTSFLVPSGEGQVVTGKASSADARTRILVLTDSFLPHSGGSREYYNNIYRNLVDLGDSEVTILTKKMPGWEEFDRLASKEFFRIKRRYKPLASLKYQELPKGLGPFLDATWHALRYSPSIVHVGDLYPPGVIAMTLKKIFGLPYVAYCHGEEVTQTENYRYQPRVRNQIYRCADAVVANSEFARQNLLRLGVQERRIYKITPGVDCARFRPIPPSKELVDSYKLKDKIVILTVARLIPRKGHKIALEAFAKISKEIPDAHYLIVGTGPEEPRLYKIVQDFELNDRVTFAGHVAAEQLPAIYGLCDLMLMPNRQDEGGDVEGFGMVFLEANAAGKPVIGGRTGGTVEAIINEVTGFLVDPNNPDEVAGILRRLLLDRLLRIKVGEAGAKRARTDFSWKTRADVLRRINLDILGRSGEGMEPRAHSLQSSDDPSCHGIGQLSMEGRATKEFDDREEHLGSVQRLAEQRLLSTERQGRE
jgi:phosphatidylinositol alpha-1,6-mannosyltransferase